MKEITQGSIIHGIRSEKYPGIPCLGIIVSARCDLANSKIPTVYLLSALKIEQWITHVGVYEAVEERIRSRRGELAKWAKNHSYDMSTLETFSIKEIEKNIDTVCHTKKDKESQLTKWSEFLSLKQLSTSESPLVAEPFRKEIIDATKRRMKDISKSSYGHYCMIPISTIENDCHKGDGLVVDLQDIIALPILLIKKIQEEKCDGMLLLSSERDKLNASLYLQNSSDFVTVINALPSPWIEWLMQCFSNSFVRIGIDRIPEDEIVEYIDIKFKRSDCNAGM